MLMEHNLVSHWWEWDLDLYFDIPIQDTPLPDGPSIEGRNSLAWHFSQTKHHISARISECYENIITDDSKRK